MIPKGWDLGDDLPPGWTEQTVRDLVARSIAAAPLQGPLLGILRRSISDPTELPQQLLEDWRPVLDIAAEAKQSPVDYIVHSLLGAASGIVAGFVDIQVRPGWIEPSCLNMIAVGDAGSGKSPALDVPDVGLRAIEADYQEEYAAAKDAWQLAEAVGDDPGPKPTLRRVRLQDTTPEAAGVQLSRMGGGCVLWQTEMSEFLAGLTRYQRQSRGFWLRAYDGHPAVVDRRNLNDEPLLIPRLAMSLVAGIQPDPLAEFLITSPRDGLAARMALIWPDPMPVSDHEVDELDWLEAEATLERAFRRLAKLRDEPPRVLLLAQDAREHFSAWRVQYLSTARDSHPDELPPHLAKGPGRVARLALTHRLLRWALRGGEIPREVPLADVRAAIAYNTYLDAHYARALADAEEPIPERLGRELARWIVRAAPQQLDLLHIRKEVRLPGLRTEARLRMALNELYAARWVALPRDDRRLPRVVHLTDEVLTWLHDSHPEDQSHAHTRHR